MSRAIMARYRGDDVISPRRDLPPLEPERRLLLKAWAKADAPTRRWTALLEMAGPTGIEAAHRLADVLHEHGWARLKESHVKGSWRLDALIWTDLAATKAELGLDSRADRKSRRAEILASLSSWVQDQPDLAVAAESLGAGVLLSAERLAERFALLKSLAQWRAEEQQGTHRDFELAARRETKSLTYVEWRWLHEHVDLPAFGVEGFAPLVWLSGPLRLRWVDGRECDLQPLQFAGLTVQDLLEAQVAQEPLRYWLIENRASFERQAVARAPGVPLCGCRGVLRPPGWQPSVRCWTAPRLLRGSALIRTLPVWRSR